MYLGSCGDILHGDLFSVILVWKREQKVACPFGTMSWSCFPFLMAGKLNNITPMGLCMWIKMHLNHHYMESFWFMEFCCRPYRCKLALATEHRHAVSMGKDINKWSPLVVRGKILFTKSWPWNDMGKAHHDWSFKTAKGRKQVNDFQTSTHARMNGFIPRWSAGLQPFPPTSVLRSRSL